MKNLLLLLFTLLFFTSCSNDGRMVEKFLSRINAREFNASSLYIYPGDHAKLRLYAEVLEKNPNTFLKLKNKQDIEINGAKGVVVELECVNPTPYFCNYMKGLHLLKPSTTSSSSFMIKDTLYIKETVDGECLTFNWEKIKGENLKLAEINESTISTMNIRKGMGTEYPVVGKLKYGEYIVIDDYSLKTNWVKCFSIDEQCNAIEGYIYRNSLSSVDNVFFSLGIFDSMGLLIAVVVFVVLGFILVLGHSIIAALFKIPYWGWFLSVGLILLLLYTFYQLIEKILFELFIINLPY